MNIIARALTFIPESRGLSGCTARLHQSCPGELVVELRLERAGLFTFRPLPFGVGEDCENVLVAVHDMTMELITLLAEQAAQRRREAA